MNKDKNIHVIVATGEWDQDHLRYRRHRLAEYLAAHPDTKEVIWVCPSIQPKEGLYPFKNGIMQYTIKDIHPNKLFRFGRYFDLFYKKKLKELQRYLSRMKQNNRLCLWYTFPGFPYLTDLVEWDQTAYDCSDLWASSISGSKNMVMMLREKSILRSEKRIAESVGTIFSTSDFLHDHLQSQYELSKPIHVLENGVEYSLFQDVEERKIDNLNIKGELVLGFIGGIKPKLDFSMLIQIMKVKKEWHLLLVGPDGTNQDPEFKALLECENVTWTGKVPPMEVPKYMSFVDVGILPYKASVYNNAVFPLKLFEFLGAGKPVAGMNLPSTKKFSQPNVYEYAEENDPAVFIELCQSLIAGLNNDGLIQKRKALAKEKDWNHIFHNMYSVAMQESQR